MIKYLIRLIFAALFLAVPAMSAHSAEMVNVEYIHQYLNARWGIDLPYNPELENPKVAANMEYLLTVVDIANEYLNGEKTTSYGTGEYATKLAADTIATNTAIDTLVRGPFTMTTTPDTTSYSMTIGAAGTFVINWGDGEIETIRNKPLGNTVYSHTYDAPGEYDITLGGRATDYAIIDLDASEIPTVSFLWADLMGGEVPTNLAKISGRLGRVFPTLENGKNPNFSSAFASAPITEIPAELFDGVHGAPVVGMFAGTFSGTQITSIPENLFAGISGAPAEWMFYRTFMDTQITSIPENLFAGISGAPAEYMFSNTFDSTQITSIPENLFAGISGAPAASMFDGTFYNTNITSIPENLFAGISGAPAERMFSSTFYNTPITSIPANLFAGISGAPAEWMFSNTFADTQITSIPENLFAGISGAPALRMFSSTFYKTPITSIPANLFGELNGNGAPYMFEKTFSWCRQLQTVEGPLFSGTITPAEEMFSNTFYESGLTSIPANLFGELNGNGAPFMFSLTFSQCSQLQTAEGPLFSGTITPAEYMFAGTFSNHGLTSIPADLFAGVRGAPAENMFNDTFQNTNITSIPENLFAGISGAPAEGMFGMTFYNTNITSIPENLFAGISGPAASGMFSSTFANCTSLTGPSARINGQYLYEIWPNSTRDMRTYENATGLSDYAQIPDNWK